MYVTVKYVNPPKNADAKYGNIKTSDDQQIMVPVQQLDQYVKGMSCDIPVEFKTWGQGNDARQVTVAVGLPNSHRLAGTPAVQGAQAQAGLYRAAPQTGSITQLTQPNAPAALAAPPRGNPEARSIFATGVVGRALGSGKFAASEIEMILKEALRAYDEHLGPPA